MSKETTISTLETKVTNVTAELNSLAESNSGADPDAIIQPATPIFKQIFNAHAREQVTLILNYLIQKK